MKHTFKWMLLSFALLVAFSNIAYAGSQLINVKINGQARNVQPVSVRVNGFPLQCKFSPYISENRTFVPIREITELMGAKVEWEQKTKSVSIKLRDKVVKLKINSNVVYIDGKKVNMSSDSIPRLTYYNTDNPETKTMVPLRFLSESLGFDVSWNQQLKQAEISNGVVKAPEINTEISQPVVDKTTEPKEEVIQVKENQVEIDKPANITPPEKNGKLTVVIDPGHGGSDPGAKAIDGQTEAELNLKVANKVVPMLKAKGYEVIMTRSRDEYIGLSNRAEIANDKNAEVFLSIHFNAFSNEKAHGIEVLYASEEETPNKTTNQTLLAQEVLDALIDETGSYNRGLKNTPKIAVLRKTNMSAALVELGFLTNPEDLEAINSSGYLDKLARGICKGIENYDNKYLK